MRNAVFLILFAGLLSACGAWPQVDGPPRDDTGAWPTLLPLEGLSALPTTSGNAQSESERLSDRAAALRNRARLMRTSVPDSDAMAALRARLAS